MMRRAAEIENPATFDIVILHDLESRFVVLADQILSFDNGVYPSVDESRRRDVNFLFQVIDLTDYLSYETTTTRPDAVRHIAVQGTKQRVVFQTHAKLTLSRLGQERFYRLPALLRESGCEEWVRGIALLDSSEEKGKQADPIPAIWIDLQSLAKRATTR